VIRIVPTSDLGLDVLLGGGWRLITRLPEKTSATVLVRGGAGSGKTLMGFQVALDLAKALNGDVAVGCVEILPSEYVAQLLSARTDIEEKRIVRLPGEATAHKEPRIFCGLLADLDPEAPDLVASLERLEKDITARGGKPVVFVVDSLIEGYGIGSSTPRISADAVIKFAVAGGYGLVLCEETRDETQSPWVFAVDTVLELGVESKERGRWIEVRKHRFGPTASGKHELELRTGARPVVYPELHAWLTRHIAAALETRGWKLTRGVPQLAWHETLVQNITPNAGAFRASFILVVGSNREIVLPIALGLLPTENKQGKDLIIEFDPLLQEEAIKTEKQLVVCYLPTLYGTARVIRTILEQLTIMFASGQLPRRVVVSEFAPINTFRWDEMLRNFASVMARCACKIPVIACGITQSPQQHSLFAYADLLLNVEGGLGGGNITSINGSIRSRWPASFQPLTWKPNLQVPVNSLPGYTTLSQRQRSAGD
jgi:hypothetical protein